MDEDTDYYRVLEVDGSADEATIKQAVKANYRRLAREHHPDKNPGDENATARFQKIQHAFDILSNDEKRKEYNEGRAGRRREAAARDAAAREAREAEQQRNRQPQDDRQRRQQEYQRRQEEEQQREEQERREEEARRQQEAQRRRDEERRQDEQCRQDNQRRAQEQHKAQEEAERQPDPGVEQPDHPNATAPTPISRLFGSLQSNWTPSHWRWLLGFVLLWIAWSLRGNSSPSDLPKASPHPVPLDRIVEGLGIGRSLGEVQIQFAETYNLPYELQLMEPLVGALIDPLDDRSSVERYRSYSADAVDGVVEAYPVINRLIDEVHKTIEAAMHQLKGMIPPKPPFYYQLAGAHTTKSSRTSDKEACEVLAPMADSIYETLDKALMRLKTTNHSLDMMLNALQYILTLIVGKWVRELAYEGQPRAIAIWESLFRHLSPRLYVESPTKPSFFYSFAIQAKKKISSAEETIMALQDRLLVFQRVLRDAPLTAAEDTLELCAKALYGDLHELGTIQADARRLQKRIRRNRRIVTSLIDA